MSSTDLKQNAPLSPGEIRDHLSNLSEKLNFLRGSL